MPERPMTPDEMQRFEEEIVQGDDASRDTPPDPSDKRERLPKSREDAGVGPVPPSPD